MGWHFGQNIHRAWQGLAGHDNGQDYAKQMNDVTWDRQKQTANNATLQNWAYNGTGPSVAQQLLNQNRGQNMAAQLGAAKTIGGDPALANRNAAEAISQGNQQSTFQSALIRSQEQQQAMQNYIDALNGTRSQDMGVLQGQQAVAKGNADRNAALTQSAMKAAASGAGGA